MRRQTKETKKVLSELMADKKHLLEIIAGQKLELEKVSARGETSSENYLYASKCKKYRVMGTAFTSDGRPYVKDDFNYRVLCMDSGASYVALVEGEKVYFDEVDDIPKDVITFITSSIRFDTAPTL